MTAADADIDGARSWYAELGVPWGMRVPLEFDWRHGRLLFEKRLMGLERLRPAPPADVRVADDLDAVVAIDAAAFGGSARAWLGPQFGAPGYETALAYLDGRRRRDGLLDPQRRPGGTGAVRRRASPCSRRRGGAGSGRALTSWLIARGFERGATLAHLHPDDDAAARLYARLGFVEVPGFNVFVNQ